MSSKISMTNSKTMSSPGSTNPVKIQALYDIEDAGTVSILFSRVNLCSIISLYRALSLDEEFYKSKFRISLLNLLEARRTESIEEEQNYFSGLPVEKQKSKQPQPGIIAMSAQHQGEYLYGTRERDRIKGAVIVRKGEGYDDNIIPVLCVDNTEVKVRTRLQRANNGNRLCEAVF